MDIGEYCDIYDDIFDTLVDILQGFSKTEKSKGLNLTIIIGTFVDVKDFVRTINRTLPYDKRHLIWDWLKDSIRFETEKEAKERQHGMKADGEGKLKVSDKIKKQIKDRTIQSFGLVGWIEWYNDASPKKKITYVVTENLEPEMSGTANDKDIIDFSPKDIQSIPDVTFRLKDINRQKELQDVGMNVDLLNTGTPAYLIVSAKEYNDAAVTKIQNAWNNRPEKKLNEEKEDEATTEILSPEAIKKQFEGCLKAIETIISNFEPKDIKAIPENIEKEPETKSGEDMRTCFKRLLSGYCKCNGLKNTVKVYRGDLFWEDRDKFEEMPRWVVKDLLKHKGKAFEKALFDKINPILKDENMTKAFASRVLKCIVY